MTGRGFYASFDWLLLGASSIVVVAGLILRNGARVKRHRISEEEAKRG